MSEQQAITGRRAELAFDTEPDSVESDRDIFSTTRPVESSELSDVEKTLQQALLYEDNEETPAITSQPTNATGEAPVNESTEPEPEPEPETTESKYSKEDLDKFQEMFKEVFGLDPTTVKSQLETQQVEASKKKLENDLSTLQTEWGVDRSEVGKRLDLVSQRLSMMSPELQRSLDNPEGIRLIWDSISSDTTRKVPPRFEKNSVPPVRAKPQLTWAQIEAMDNETYARNAEAIQAAVLKGLVK